jgi:hypothetical protein
VKDQNKKNELQVSINLDSTPVLYTDNINMTVNPDGVVMDVMQRLGPTNQNRIVARIGMSREHAKKFLDKLGEMLLKSEGKAVSGKKIVN